MEPAQLEFSLRRSSQEHVYDIELRYARSEDDAEVQTRAASFRLSDVMELAGLPVSSEDYGVRLGEFLLGAAEILTTYSEITAVAAADDAPMRVRLSVEPAAPELHRLKWEVARHPQTRNLLFTGDAVYFSRYVASTDFRPIRRKSRQSLSALAMIANPTDTAEYAPTGKPLAPVDAAGEEARFRAALNGISADVLSSPGTAATLTNLIARLRKETPDILYLVCHGAFVNGEPHLWLEAADGTADVVAGSDFIGRLTELWKRPSLIVLASCQSAGQGDARLSDDEGVLSALGPRLADAGIPAVLAMQGNITMKTVERFIPLFFSNLADEGQLDRAVSVARGQVRGEERADWWAPVLFMRLKSGAIWSRHGFGDGFQRWPAIVTAIRNRKCTPILGPGLLEGLAGSPREHAWRLAQKYHVPLTPRDREDFPQVAQYIAVDQAPEAVRRDYVLSLCSVLQHRFEDLLPALDRQPPDRNAPVEEYAAFCERLLAQVWRARFTPDDPDPYRILAALPFPIYVSTSPEGLLAEALREVELPAAPPARPEPRKKDPVVEVARWNDSIEGAPSIFEEDPGFRPDEARPMVFHLFGRLGVPESVVLTQDDYFDSLIATTGRAPLPDVLGTALTNRTLLFLGFEVDEWNFRVLFRLIRNMEGNHLLRKHRHVAVQLDPEDQRFADPAAASRYLARYFQEADIDIFWGSVDDFLSELHREYHR
jgi:hypothetical protein